MADYLKDFFNPNKEFTFKYIPGPQVNGRVLVDNDARVDDSFLHVDDNDDKDYHKPYVMEEQKLYEQAANAMPKQEVKALEDVCGSETTDHYKDIAMEMYRNYSLTTNTKVSLTIFRHKQEILDMVENNQVVVIEGPTGCGKSTQVPQFLFDYCFEKKEYCKIVVTQPRRIAASSIAKRVCDERGWNLGEFCGYQVGLDRKTSCETILTYVTTGVLLQKLIKSQNLLEFSHVIIDEVHERTQEMDFLLLLVRKFLYTNSPNTKVIIMSATFNTKQFAEYFSRSCGSVSLNAPVISIKKDIGYTIRTFYLDHLQSITTFRDFNINEPRVHRNLYDLCMHLLNFFSETDRNAEKLGHVLIFLPGINEIEELYGFLTNAKRESSVKWKILPLHSSITTNEQKKVFETVPHDTRKIILSTNIAESSITIDVEYVIDFCLNKILMVDPVTKYESLQMVWATHVNCTQRAGRVGRLSHGRVYRLVTKEFYSDEMHESNTPEILRAPLERLVLASKLLNISGPPHTILALALDPPDLKYIKSTIWFLKECGGLLKTQNGVSISFDGEITFLGRAMATLPLNVTLTKFIILGYIYGCLNECIIIAAGCSLHNVFATPFQARLNAYKTKLIWADGSASDLIALLNLYRVWERQKKVAYVTCHSWAQQNCLNARTLRDWEILVSEITDRLKYLGIVEKQSQVSHDKREVPIILKVVICGAFYPNYFVRSSEAGQIDEREAVRVLGGRDPSNTVYLTNMDSSQPGELYVQSIKKQMQCVSNNISVNFDTGSSKKIYITFSNITDIAYIKVDGRQYAATTRGRVHPDIFKAIRMRQLKIPIVLNLLPLDTALQRVEQNTVEHTEEISESVETNIFNKSQIELQATKIVDVGHFWAHVVHTSTHTNLELIYNSLNTTQLLEATEIHCDGLYATKWTDGKYYRCTMISLKANRQVEVFFIDYGDRMIVPAKSLKNVPKNISKIPPQCIECMLSEIQPSLGVDREEGWSEAARELFNSVMNIKLYGKIYSVVDGVVRLKLYKSNPNTSTKHISFNELLISNGHAEATEESFRSKENHLERQKLLNSGEQNIEQKFVLQKDIRQDITSPTDEECKNRINLSGPFSPLEMNVYPINVHGHNIRVVVEGGSVNSVLLDSEPHDPHERLLVAAYVGQNPAGTSLQARLTTLMPSIPGWPPLMCLMFCPCVELKPTPDGTRLAGILCGLGPENETSKKSLYPIHDIYMTLDVEITYEDLDKINEIRYWMNTAMDCMESEYLEIKPNFKIDHCRKQIKEKLMMLLRIKRNSAKRVLIEDRHLWNNYPEGINTIEVPWVNLRENKQIWPLHMTIKLNTAENSNAKKTEIKEELERMLSLGRKDIPFEVISCPICIQTLFDPTDIISHIISVKHKTKLKELNLA